jgi:hypothetical protein
MKQPRSVHGNEDSECMSALMELDPDPGRVWRPDELGAVYRHQMSAPVQFDLGGIDPALCPKLQALAAAENLLVRSFHDLLAHPSPPLELLRLVKDYAKANRRHRTSALPPEVATVLYYACIAAALVRCGKRITTLDDAALAKGFAWVLALGWVEEPVRTLCRLGSARVQAAGAAGGGGGVP